MTIARLSGEDVAGKEPPSEFRLFARGWNKTSKGNFLFDEKAAVLVMSAYKRANVDVMIDLEHLSLDTESNAYNPDAQAWCKLVVRDGSLWATDVRWAPHGEERIRTLKQRYVSPTFEYDPESKRIEALYNIAICAIPATYDAPALVAASKRSGKKLVTLAIEVSNMDDLKKIAAALGLEDTATVEDILGAIKALTSDESSADGDTETVADENPADSDDDTESMSDDDAKDAAKLSKNLPPKMAARIVAALSTNKTLRERLTKLEKKTATDEIRQLLKDNTDKVSLSLEPWFLSQTPDAARAFLKHAAVAPRAKVAPKVEGTTDVVELSEEEKKVASLTGSDPKKLLEFKKQKLAADKASA